jgi:hypothetical protein
MKILLAIAMVGFGITAAQAGSKSVITPVIDINPIYFLYTTQTDGTPQILTEGVSAGAGPAPTTGSSRGQVAQTGYAPGTQSDVYAKLLKEAQKRGLR